jgi:very-short-patch-repair endonuclease
VLAVQLCEGLTEGKLQQMKPYPQPLSVGEETFALHCQAYKLSPTREYRFCDRQWRFDFAFPERKIAVEVEGGTSFGKSRHSRGAGFERDAEKYNRAAREGWVVLRYTTGMVVAGTAIDEVLEVLNDN